MALIYADQITSVVSQFAKMFQACLAERRASPGDSRDQRMSKHPENLSFTPCSFRELSLRIVVLPCPCATALVDRTQRRPRSYFFSAMAISFESLISWTSAIAWTILFVGFSFPL